MGHILVSQLGKAYKRYPNRWARLFEWLDPRGLPRHEPRWVLRNIDFSVSPGEAVGIIGRNGAGKSTLLKIITGTTLPTEGRVAAGGQIAALLELGMGFHPDFTGRQNVFMAGRLMGHSSETIAREFGAIEAFADIGDYLDQPVRVYSTGMQVRLAFSVATAIRPDILIVDEALAVGDVFFQQKCFARIRAFREAGTTLLFVSHALGSVYSLCERAILIEDGRIALDDKPKAVIDLYNARLVQHANLDPAALQVMEEAAADTPHPNPLPQGERGPEGEGCQRVQTVGSYATAGAGIESVQMLDSGQQIVDSLISGSEVVIRVRIRFAAPYADPHAGFQIRDSRGEAIFMTTTYGMRQSLGLVRAGTVVEVDFFIRHLALAEGQYTLTAGVANEGSHQGEFREALARLQNALAFTVLRNYDAIHWAGVYNLAPQCEIRRVGGGG
ncbi:MAG: ABC transporter ATP-binding protein [Pseudomonadota bacterium]